MGSAILQVPELALDETEAKKLALAIEGVNEQYKIALDPKKAAWIDLVQVAGVIYGPRAVAFYIRKKAQARPLQFHRQAGPVRPATAAAPPVDDNPITAPDLNTDKTKQNGKMPQGFDPTNLKLMN